MKVIKSLENRQILLKGTIENLLVEKENLLVFLGHLIAGLPLRWILLTPIAKIVLLQFGLSAGMAATDELIQQKIYESRATALTISNKKTQKISLKSLEESCLSMKKVSETIKNEAKEQKGGFLPMLLGTLDASFLS